MFICDLTKRGIVAILYYWIMMESVGQCVVHLNLMSGMSECAS